jgi:hypothetical protein
MMKPNTAQQTQAPNPLIHADGNGYGWVSGTVLSDDLLRRILFFAPARQGPPRLALAVFGRRQPPLPRGQQRLHLQPVRQLLPQFSLQPPLLNIARGERFTDDANPGEQQNARQNAFILLTVPSEFQQRQRLED